jgi:hypothetical protein
VKATKPIYLQGSAITTSRGRKYALLGRKCPFCNLRESALNSFLSSSASLRTEHVTDALEAIGETRPTWPRRKARQGETLSGRLINISPSAYSYPLPIKHLLHSSMMHAADQEIVYRDLRREHTGDDLLYERGELADGVQDHLPMTEVDALRQTCSAAFMAPEAVVEMAVYTAEAMLHCKGKDVWEMLVENIP